ncbi:MAG: bifunctional fucokinase/fucose-1-phosphate guanylyltransferase [Verrucomicrobiae bacterium]|nr:bifunctional fucokinase/fucose-1-phosphate guanylyltransferase [Verrucomicrobiae bacterium]
MNERTQFLVTLPWTMAERFAELEKKSPPEWLAISDPISGNIGSGGASCRAIFYGWKKTGENNDFFSWLNESKKIIIHGGGLSRRLPAYSAIGKPLTPIPVFRWARGQRLNQTLLDLQSAECEKIMNHAPDSARVMIVSGDVLLRIPGRLPPLPQADIICLGIRMPPEKAKDFGVFFCARTNPETLAFSLQKPTAARIRDLSVEYLYYADAGVWLLSQKATRALMESAGWLTNGKLIEQSKPYDLYGDFGSHIGTKPVTPNNTLSNLTCAIAVIPQAEFYHFGSTRQLIESVSEIQNLELDETKLGLMGAKRHPDQYLQNACFEYPLRLEENHTLWVENSHIPNTWCLSYNHVFTGVPQNTWQIHLQPGVCFDFTPIDQDKYCVRVYGFNDSFKGTIADASTTWINRKIEEWFKIRKIDPTKAGITPDTDIYEARLFPIKKLSEITSEFLEWFYSENPSSNHKNTEFAREWLNSERLSCRDILQRINPHRLYEQRDALRKTCLLPMLKNYRYSVFFKLDLESTSKIFAETEYPLPELTFDSWSGLEPLQEVHDQMFRSAVLRHRGKNGWDLFEKNAFARLREMIVRDAQLSPVDPRPCAQEDQIVWARSPVRLDLAGGWTDTPPYCLEYGGRVINLAVDLNGQPPIQVFAKLSKHKELVVRSIDLGVEEKIQTYQKLDTFAQPGSEFALAKAALALAGFLPRFHTTGKYPTLQAQLEDFGWGIEISMVSAVPKGSGLGTSSILAATLLATLSDLCGLQWDKNALFTRTLALEQMLTTGGGWQDQAGAIYWGIKLIETSPGLAQKPVLRWFPDHLFSHSYANRVILLYYTGITRLAKSILQEIVRGIFLNSPAHLRCVEEISQNVDIVADALEKCDYNSLAKGINNSWLLNQKLDEGTNPPEIQAIIDRVKDYLLATKLLGAGGGGYLLMLAKDEQAATKIVKTLKENPPNNRARFVSFQLSTTGLQITRS